MELLGREGPDEQSSSAPVAKLDVARAEALPPLFRWPGGKRWLVPTLLNLLPVEYGRYYEPFLGAGALFFALRPSAATISDANAQVMDCYRYLRADPGAVSRHLLAMPRTKDDYYRIRSERPLNPYERAARFIYLAQLAFNGIYRVNKDGDFNVPYSGRTYDALGDLSVLRGYADALTGASITHGDFAKSLHAATKGDLVYLDPPYTVAHPNNGFLKYNDRIFSWRDQLRLANTAATLANRGCWVIISNAAHESTLLLYPGFRRIDVERPSTISAMVKGRGTRPEFVFTNIPPAGLVDDG